MSRYRLYPTAMQEQKMLDHCAHARYVWNLAVEQVGYRAHRQRLPTYIDQCRQLTEARRENDWLGSGSVCVQQQALRDFHQACRNWWKGVHRRPGWRKKGKHREGFRIVDGTGVTVRNLNRRWSSVRIPLVGIVKFRRTRDVPDAHSFRVNLGSSGRWHIAFAVIPGLTPGPADGSVVGIDRGVTVTLALSDGSKFQTPVPASTKAAQRATSRCKRGSNRRRRAKALHAKLYARNTDRRKDWVEKVSTDIARRYDLIRIEDLQVQKMVRSARGTRENPGRKVKQKAGLNRSILSAGWSMFARRLEDKAAGRVEKINPAFTSQRCSVCGHVSAESRKSQALFACVACKFTSNADLNAARNIAAGLAVRRAEKVSALKRVPQRAPAA